MKKQLIIIGIIILLLTVGLSGCMQNDKSKNLNSDNPNDKDIIRYGYPLIANYQHRYEVSEKQANLLAKYDLVVLDLEVAYYTPNAIQIIRNKNPNIIILVYVPIGIFNPLPPPYGYFRKMIYDSSEENWWLHFGENYPNEPYELRRVYLWSNYVSPNPTSNFSNYLVDFINDKITSTKLFDGIFYDCVWEGIDNSKIDIDNDGIADSKSYCDTQYMLGITKILRMTRQKLGKDAIIMGNPGVEWSDSSPYWNYSNGHMQENALGNQFGSDWPEIFNIYLRNMGQNSSIKRMHWIASDVRYNRTVEQAEKLNQDDLSKDDLRRMRFGLGITLLLDDGYFSFDQGDGLHNQFWWFPEYDVELGFPVDKYEQLDNGILKRNFDNGMVIVNPSEKDITVNLEKTYRDVSTDMIGDNFSVSLKDSIILIKV